jgi:hypothetical protein
MSTINEQRQPTREESTVWSSVLGTSTPRLISSSTRTQRASTWNELFQSTVPSATESTKPPNNSWLKFWSAPDPSSADVTLPNGHETETNNPVKFIFLYRKKDQIFIIIFFLALVLEFKYIIK